MCISGCDNSLHEYIYNRLKYKERSVWFSRQTMKKAYDSVNWEFLYYMLGRFEGKMGRMDMSVFGL